MNEIFPDPPIPPDADLKDFAFTPIYRARLFGSAFHARASDSEWRAGVTLWLKAQDQVPAGSLPDDDVDLCRLAELGRDLKTWRKIKAGALHGWYKANDGRLYNDVVAEVANDQWASKLARRDRTEKARQARLSQRLSQTEPLPLETSVTESVTDEKKQKKPSKGQRQGQRQRQGQGDSKNGGGGSAHAREADLDAGKPTSAEQVAQHFVAERDRLWPNTSRLPGPMMTIRSQAQQFLDRGAPPELLREVMTRGMERSAADGKSPPSTLSAYQASLADAVASHLRPMPDGEADPFPAAPAGRPNGFKSRSTIQAEKDALARQWREQGGIGPDPADPSSPNYPGGSS